MSLGTRYVELVLERLPLLFVLAALPQVALGLWPRWRSRVSQKLLLGAPVIVALAVGAVLAYRRAAVFDDAFISFRYAENFLAGDGLVFNVGERVEGYTNLLWTLMLAGLSAVSGVELPTVSLALGALVYVSSVPVVALVGRRLNALPSQRYLPLAAVLFAVQGTVCDFATSGLETLFASLCVNLGVLALLAERSRLSALAAGASLVAATLAHPDHAIFYAAGGIALLQGSIRGALKERTLAPLTRSPEHMIAYAAPLAVLGAVLLWKHSYYGSILPNTYYAKSGGDPYFSQGLEYALTYYLGSQLWLLLLPAAWWTIRGSGNATFRTFFAVSFLAYNAYVMKIGGDFMYGRLYVVVTPLLLLAAEGAVYGLVARGASRFAVGAAAGLLTITTYGLPLIRGQSQRHAGIADESRVYQVQWTYPLTIRHPNYRVGRLFRRTLTERGLSPLVASSGVGMLGYYSKLPVLDLVGLIDPVVAHQPLLKRGRPGHEKWATEQYLGERQPVLMRNPRLDRKYARYAGINHLTLGRGLPNNWSVFTYDRALISELRQVAPELRIRDFEKYLDRYIERVDRLSPKRVRSDLRFFQRYYFDHNDDAARLAPILRASGR